MAGEPTAKERMLKNIRKGLIEKKENPYPELEPTPLYSSNLESLDLVFATAFTEVKGEFIYCEDEDHFIDQYTALVAENNWKDIRIWDTPLKLILSRNRIQFNESTHHLENAQAGFTLCEALVARNGSVLVSSGLESGRGLMILPPVHIVLAFQHQLVMDIKQGFSVLKEKYGEDLPSSVALITGPSRTADIEKTLVLGAHGPKQLFVFLVDTI
jgi:L-lactate dehydrogenase complex protein LldG